MRKSKQLTPKRQDILMQIHFPLARPGLKGRTVARHGGKVAVVQPVNDLVLLTEARPALRVVRAVYVRPERESGALVRRLGVVGFDEAGADEEQVADLDGAAGRGGADVDALSSAAGLELGVAYGMTVVGVCVTLALDMSNFWGGG